MNYGLISKAYSNRRNDALTAKEGRQPTQLPLAAGFSGELFEKAHEHLFPLGGYVACGVGVESIPYISELEQVIVIGAVGLALQTVSIRLEVNLLRLNL